MFLLPSGSQLINLKQNERQNCFVFSTISTHSNQHDILHHFARLVDAHSCKLSQKWVGGELSFWHSFVTLQYKQCDETDWSECACGMRVVVSNYNSQICCILSLYSKMWSLQTITLKLATAIITGPIYVQPIDSWWQVHVYWSCDSLPTVTGLISPALKGREVTLNFPMCWVSHSV